MGLLNDARHDVRIVTGVVLAVLSAGVFSYDKHDATSLADRDFALCGRALMQPGCTSRTVPVFTGWVESSSNGFRRTYHVTVATGPHVSVTVGDLKETDAAPFASLREAEVRYRDGRLAAIVGERGATIKVPFAFTRRAVGLAIAAIVLLLAGGGLFAWGFARLNNRPRASA